MSSSSVNFGFVSYVIVSSVCLPSKSSMSSLTSRSKEGVSLSASSEGKGTFPTP